MRLKGAPQNLNFVMAKAALKSYTLDCSCKCPCYNFNIAIFWKSCKATLFRKLTEVSQNTTISTLIEAPITK